MKEHFPDPSTVEMNLSEISCVLFLVAVLETISSSNSLSGDHVCSRIEKSVLGKEEEIERAIKCPITRSAIEHE